jgi:hypothetical protein
MSSPLFFDNLINDNENNIQTAFLFDSNFKPSTDKITEKDIKKIADYLINNCYYKKNIKNEMKTLYDDFLKILNRCIKYLKINKFIITNVVLLMEKLNKTGNPKYFVFDNILFYFIICFIIIDKFMNDINFRVKEVLKVFNFNYEIGMDTMFEILDVVDYDLNMTSNDIQRIYCQIF